MAISDVKLLDLLQNNRLAEARSYLESFDQNGVLMQILWSNYYEKISNREKALQYSIKGYSMVNPDHDIYIRALVRYLYSLFFIKDFEEFKRVLLTNKNLLEQNNNLKKIDQIKWLSHFLYLMGLCLLEYQKEYQKSIPYLKKSLDMREQIEDKILISHSLNSLAVAYEWSSELQKALEYYNRSISLKLELNDRLGYAITLANMGALHSNMGYLDLAEKSYSEAMEIFISLNDTSRIAWVHELFGYIAKRRRNYEIALSHYQQAYQLSIKSNTQRDILSSLNKVISIHILLGNIDEAERLFHKYENEVTQNDFSDMKVPYLLLKASLLKRRPRAINKLNAQEIYRSLLSKDQKYEIIISSLINLTDLLILELRSYSNSDDEAVEIYSELSEVFDLLEKEIQKYNSDVLTAELIRIQAKIFVIKGDLTKAKKYFDKAYNIAVNNDNFELSNLIKNENDNFILSKQLVSDSTFLAISNSLQNINHRVISTISELSAQEVSEFNEILNKKYKQIN